MSTDLTNDPFLEELSEPKPNPGGGSASAHGALLALCIAEKVARLELGRHSQGKGASSGPSLAVIEDLKARLLSLREQDSQAYLRLVEARASDDGDPQFAEALTQAINCPMMIVKVGLRILACVSEIGASCKKHLLSDLQVALEFSFAAMRGAFHIARANVKLTPNSAMRKKRLKRLTALQKEAERAFRYSSDLLNSYAVEK
jgi:formiminotetrahydrofolate cyclodeaminase